MNIIEIAIRNDNVTDIAKLNAKILCNALTGALVRETESFVRSGESQIPGFIKNESINDDAGRVQNTDHETSIEDQSNDDRETPDGMSLEQASFRELGYDVASPYANMCVLNGLRHFVYNDLFKFVDIAPAKDALYTNKPRTSGEAVNWDQPMSAEQFLDFRIKLAGNVNERDLRAAVVEDPKADADHLRDIFQESARRRQVALKETRTSVLAEILSLPEDCHDTDGFKVVDTRGWDTLPIKLQLSIATRLVDNMQKEHDRLQTIRSEKMAGLRTLIRAELVILSAAVDALVRKARSSE